jgi:hypothetical protein
MKLIVVALTILTVGCSGMNCRAQKEADMKNAGTPAVDTPEVKKEDRIKVYKNDGSLQCGMGKKIAVDVMQNELGKIPVFSSVNRNDGMMHMQQCGTPTGFVNVFEIPKKDLEAAKKAGFKLWTFD